ncbi:MAG: PQQ-binding-like beta-propeller repeat protein [Candidatus Aenigmarchaeota archaeon]|nr:PQQ-binding-like beta-propeller repeat protein [Candidatus Aenigmarchaeota archaeon]
MNFDDFNIEIRDLGVREKTDGLRWDHTPGGTVACIPASDGKILYFGCDNSIFYALDTESGKELWRFETGGCMGNATPSVYGGMILFGSYDSYIYCIEKETGKMLWRYKTGGKVVSGTAVTKERIIFGSRDGYVYCLNHEGHELWRFRTGDEILSTPAIRDNLTYIGSYDCNMYCINIETGKESWRFTTGGAVANLPPVNLHDNSVIFGSWDFNVYCADRFTGKQIWRAQLSGGMLQGGKTENGVLYIGTRNSNVFYEIDLRDGRIIREIKTEVHMHASNVEILDGNIYVGGGTDDYGPGKIYCINKEGEILWTFSTDGPSWVGPVITDEKLFAGSWNCRMYRIDPTTGKQLWNFRTSGAPSNEKVIDKNRFEVQTIIAKEELDDAENMGTGYSAIPQVRFSSGEYGTKSEYGGKSEYSSGEIAYK